MASVICAISWIALVPILSATATTFVAQGEAADEFLVLLAPPTTALFGQLLSPQPLVRLNAASGRALAFTEVEVRADDSADASAADLEALRWAAVSGDLIDGGSVLTDGDGYVQFESLRFLQGWPGRYRLRFVSGEAESDAFDVDVLPEVASLADGVAVNSLGQPLAGKRVYAVPTRAVDPLVAPLWDRFAVLEGAVVETDEDGGYSFPALASLGANTASASVSFFSEGVLLEEAVTLVPDGVVAALVVDTDPPTDAVEGLAFATQPVVRLLDSSGDPVQGRYVVAMEAAEAGTDLYRQYSRRDEGARKRLLSPVSAVSDANGYAAFADLGFSVRGPAGAYAVQFVCDGVASASLPIEVTSTVALVEIVALNPVDSLGFAANSNLLSPQPVVLVTDASLAPLAGKTVSVVTASEGALYWDTPAVTAENGYAAFTDLRVVSASPFSTIDVSFAVDGVVSNTSVTLYFLDFPVLFASEASDDSCGSLVAHSNSGGLDFEFTVLDSYGNTITDTDHYSLLPVVDTGDVATLIRLEPSGPIPFASSVQLTAEGPSTAFTVSWTLLGGEGDAECAALPIVLHHADGTLDSLTWAPGLDDEFCVQALDVDGEPLADLQPAYFVRHADEDLLATGAPFEADNAHSDASLTSPYADWVDERFSPILLDTATDADGIACLQNLTWAPAVSGTITLLAAVGGVATDDSVEVELEALAASLGVFPPANTADAGADALDATAVVTVLDADDEPVEGEVVGVALTVTGAVLSGAVTATTNASGVAVFADLAVAAASAGCHELEFSVAADSVTGSQLLCVSNAVTNVIVTDKPVVLTTASGVGLAGDVEVAVVPAAANVLIQALQDDGTGTVVGEAYTDSTGYALLQGLAVAETSTLDIFAAGVVSDDTVTITVSETVTGVTIVEQPPAVGMYVNELYAVPMQVLVVVESGAALPGVEVVAELTDCFVCSEDTNGELEEEAARATTDSRGVATFSQLLLSAGRPGTYAIRFSSGGKTSDTSLPFYVDNRVTEVEILEQWYAGVYLLVDTVISPQPTVRVVSDAPLVSKRVTVAVENPGSGADRAAVAYTPVYTDSETGEAVFSDLRFVSGKNVEYRIVFLIDGMDSASSNSIMLRNPSVADFSELNILSYAVYSSLWVIPMLTAITIEPSRSRGGYALWLLLGTLFTVLMGMLLVFSFLSDFVEWYNQTDLAVALVVVSVVCVLTAVTLHGLTALVMSVRCFETARRYCARIGDFPGHRLARARVHVKSLLRGAADGHLHIAKPEPLAPGVLAKVSRFFTRVFNRVSLLQSRDPVFLFPTRLLVTLLASYLFTFFALLLMLQVVLLINGGLEALRLSLVSVFAIAGDFVRFTGDACVVSRDTIVSSGALSNVTATAELLNVTFDTPLDGTTAVDSCEAYEESGGEEIDSWDDWLGDVQVSLWASGVAALVMSMIAITAIVVDMLLVYRDRMLSLRRGEYVFKVKHYAITQTPMFMGYQIAHLSIGAATMFWLFTFFFFVMVDAQTRATAWEFALYALLAVVGFNFVLQRLSRITAARYLVTHRTLTVHRKLFAAYDFVLTFLNLASAFFVALFRMLASAFFQLFQVLRLDQPCVASGIEHLDLCYASYAATMLVDHQHNNLVALVFVSAVMDALGGEGTQLKRKGARWLPSPSSSRKEGVELRQVEDLVESPSCRKLLPYFRWHLALTLIRNRQLVVLRKRGRNVDGRAGPAQPPPSPPSPAASPSVSSREVVVDQPPPLPPPAGGSATVVVGSSDPGQQREEVEALI